MNYLPTAVLAGLNIAGTGLNVKREVAAVCSQSAVANLLCSYWTAPSRGHRIGLWELEFCSTRAVKLVSGNLLMIAQINNCIPIGVYMEAVSVHLTVLITLHI